MSSLTPESRAEWSRRLANALVASAQVPEATMAAVVEEAVGTDAPLATLLISRALAPPVSVVTTLGQLARLPTVDLELERPSPDAEVLLPPLLARDHQAVVLRAVGRQVVTAFAEPPAPGDLRALSDQIGYEVVPVLGDPVVIATILGPGPVDRAQAEPGPAPGPAAELGPAAERDAQAEPAPPTAWDARVEPDSQAEPGAAAEPGVAAERHAQAEPAPSPAPVASTAPDPAVTMGEEAVMAVSGAPVASAAAGAPVASSGAGIGAVPTDPLGPDLAPPPVPPPGDHPGATQWRELARTDRVEDLPLHIDDLLRYAVNVGASDLHLTAEMPPTMRLHGALRPIEGVSRLGHNELRDMIFGVLPQSQRERFEAEHELDTSHTIAGVGRFRVNVSLQRETVAVALRPIPHQIPEFDTLGLPDSVGTVTEMRRGLVLVTGPTGSGKSTTLASLIDIINRTKPLHIVTVEDPIEFLHTHKRSIITQREVGQDTASFSEALRRALRQDPDVILVGEMRDLETISTALTAAETGHLVFASLHTQDAPSTVDRVIDVFPPSQQDQIRIQLGSSLRAVVTQQLVPTSDGGGRCVAAEVMMCTAAISNLIRAAKTHQIYSLMQTGGQYGMQTMDQSLAQLVRQGRVTVGLAVDRCRNEEDFRNHLYGGM